MFKLDKTVSKTTTLEESSDNIVYWQSKSMNERLAAAIFLIKTAYRISQFPSMEKNIYSTRKLID